MESSGEQQKGTDPGQTVTISLRLITPERARRVLTRIPPADERWAPGYPTDGDLVAIDGRLRQQAHGIDPGPFGIYDIVDRTGMIVGGAGFHGPPDAQGVVEVGYDVVESEQKKGYATAALVMLCDLARQNGARLVVARARPRNLASRRVMEKAGLHYTGEDQGLARYEQSVE
jgi:RimJ/RimL family protein N-acetyltransferase